MGQLKRVLIRGWNGNGMERMGFRGQLSTVGTGQLPGWKGK